MKHRRYRKGECDIETDENTYSDEDESFEDGFSEPRKGWW
jgi:hypothetical protein